MLLWITTIYGSTRMCAEPLGLAIAQIVSNTLGFIFSQCVVNQSQRLLVIVQCAYCYNFFGHQYACTIFGI